MAGTGGASMVESDGRCNSENRNERLNSGEDEEEDRLSALPDLLIHRILSFLPATDLVKTSVLSKSWKYQWTHVPVLNLIPSKFDNIVKLSNFIDKTLILHNCSNIEKFVIDLEQSAHSGEFPNLEAWIHFAVRKNVKKLIVVAAYYTLPQFVFDISPVVKLKLACCVLMPPPIGKVNWESLKSLRLHWCEVEQDKAIENFISVSPQLEYLELISGTWWCNGFVIASKSLKTLILDGVYCDWNVIEISCPNLERLRITGALWFTGLKLMNLKSSVYAALDFHLEGPEEDFKDYIKSLDDCINLVRQTLLQVQHVEKLEIGRWLMEILLSSKEDGDCIGGLPDPVIHRIISFLPSTKDAFKTDYDNRWQRKWTDVPMPNFVSSQ